MTTDRLLKDDFEQYGRVWLRDSVSDADLALLDKATANTTKAGQKLASSVALDAVLSKNSSLLASIRLLDPMAVAVRTVAFNKSESANWGVPWHQDRVIAVNDKVDVDGYDNWTKKSGTWHCEPSKSILIACSLFAFTSMMQINPMALWKSLLEGMQTVLFLWPKLKKQQTLIRSRCAMPNEATFVFSKC